MQTSQWRVSRRLVRASAYGILSILIVGVPLQFSSKSGWFIQSTYGQQNELFEMFGVTASLALALVLALEWWGGRRSWRALGPVLVGLLVGFHFLPLFTDYAIQTWDYGCYERAARAIAAGGNPYAGTGYLYPPSLALILSSLQTSLNNGGAGSTAAPGLTVFYIYQTSQWLVLMLSYFLSYRLCRQLGATATAATLLVGILFVVNAPLVRTLRNNQANLMLMATHLGAMVLAARHGGWAGFVAGIGTHIKATPLLLIVPWLITRRWWAALAMIATIAGIVLYQTAWGSDGTIFSEYVVRIREITGDNTYLRNSSLYSMLAAAGRVFGIEPSRAALMPVARVLSGLIIAWFGWRALQRERITAHATPNDPRQYDYRFRLMGHLTDANVLPLLIAPLVWPHHFVVAVPFILWSVIALGSRQSLAVALGVVLVLAPPVLVLFPLAFSRTAGLLYLLYLTSPGRLSAHGALDGQDESIFLYSGKTAASGDK